MLDYIIVRNIFMSTGLVASIVDFLRALVKIELEILKYKQPINTKRSTILVVWFIWPGGRALITNIKGALFDYESAIIRESSIARRRFQGPIAKGYI